MSGGYLTFDCYGTLVDWRDGILSAFDAATTQAGERPEPEQLLALHARHEAEVQAGPYRPYREVLAETARRMAVGLRLAAPLAPYDFLADSLPRWRAFPEVDAALVALRARGYRLGILSNVDDDLLSATLGQFTVDFDLLITAEQVRSYKPAPAHFLRARDRIGGGRRWLHVAQSWFHDIAAAGKLGIPTVWVNRLGEAPAAGPAPRAVVSDLDDLVRRLT